MSLKILGALLGAGIGVWGMRKIQAAHLAPTISPIENIDQVGGVSPVSLGQHENGFDLSVPYFMPFVPREQGGLLANLYGDQIYMPSLAQGGDLVVNNITVPDYKVVHDDVVPISLRPNVTRAMQVTPQVVPTPFVLPQPQPKVFGGFDKGYSNTRTGTAASFGGEFRY